MAYHTIKLKPFGEPAIAEYAANAAITPGMQVYILSTGKVAKHAAAGTPCIRAFALEQGNIGGAVSTDITSGEVCQVWYPRPGDLVACLLAAGENVAIGDKAESGANGTVRKVVADTSVGTVALSAYVGVFEEAKDLSGSGAVATLVKVRII
jgi:hypothetical protein